MSNKQTITPQIMAEYETVRQLQPLLSLEMFATQYYNANGTPKPPVATAATLDEYHQTAKRRAIHSVNQLLRGKTHVQCKQIMSKGEQVRDVIKTEIASMKPQVPFPIQFLSSIGVPEAAEYHSRYGDELCDSVLRTWNKYSCKDLETHIPQKFISHFNKNVSVPSPSTKPRTFPLADCVCGLISCDTCHGKAAASKKKKPQQQQQYSARSVAGFVRFCHFCNGTGCDKCGKPTIRSEDRPPALIPSTSEEVQSRTSGPPPLRTRERSTNTINSSVSQSGPPPLKRRESSTGKPNTVNASTPQVGPPPLRTRGNPSVVNSMATQFVKIGAPRDLNPRGGASPQIASSPPALKLFTEGKSSGPPALIKSNTKNTLVGAMPPAQTISISADIAVKWLQKYAQRNKSTLGNKNWIFFAPSDEMMKAVKAQLNARPDVKRQFNKDAFIQVHLCEDTTPNRSIAGQKFTSTGDTPCTVSVNSEMKITTPTVQHSPDLFEISLPKKGELSRVRVFAHGNHFTPSKKQ